MKKFLLFALLLGLPSPLFAGKDGYKKQESCESVSGKYYSLWQNKSNTDYWGVTESEDEGSSGKWYQKKLYYDQASIEYEDLCSGM